MNKWWQKAVVYQVYPRSFMDSNGDGIGDLQGIISKLDYLQNLGVNMIWLSPVYASPNDDNGYDISNYYEIMPEFGTLADMERLIAEAKNRGISIIMDIVANHTSDEHMWFEEAKKGTDNPYHDFYVWRKGKDGAEPNELKSIFSGSAWEYEENLDMYYLHFFSKKQPDLNWKNPKVREEVAKMLNWWIDKGIEGFRFDVIDLIAKDADKMIGSNGEKLHDYIQEMMSRTSKDKELLTVGETWGATTEIAKLYSDPSGKELSMVFQFEHISLDQQENKEKWDLKTLELKDLKSVFKKWQNELHNCGWNSLFWNNHDLPRIVSRWGNDKDYRVESAKMLAILLHMMQGTPYIFQGEELGMTNVKFDSIDEYQDIETLNMYKERISEGFVKEEIMKSIYAKGRDNARTPMQWNAENNAGFSTGDPWLKLNPNYCEINVESALKDENSIFYFYKELVSLRRNSEYSDLIAFGSFEMLYEENEQIFAYKRKYKEQEITVLCNFYDKPCQLTLEKSLNEEQIILHNYKNIDCSNAGLKLRPYEALIISE